MAALLQANGILERQKIPQEDRIVYATLRELRNWGLTPLQIQEALRAGRMVRTEPIKLTAFPMECVKVPPMPEREIEPWRRGRPLRR